MKLLHLFMLIASLHYVTILQCMDPKQMLFDVTKNTVEAIANSSTTAKVVFGGAAATGATVIGVGAFAYNRLFATGRTTASTTPVENPAASQPSTSSSSNENARKTDKGKEKEEEEENATINKKVPSIHKNAVISLTEKLYKAIQEIKELPEDPPQKFATEMDEYRSMLRKAIGGNNIKEELIGNLMKVNLLQIQSSNDTIGAFEKQLTTLNENLQKLAKSMHLFKNTYEFNQKEQKKENDETRSEMAYVGDAVNKFEMRIRALEIVSLRTLAGGSTSTAGELRNSIALTQELLLKAESLPFSTTQQASRRRTLSRQASFGHARSNSTSSIRSTSPVGSGKPNSRSSSSNSSGQTSPSASNAAVPTSLSGEWVDVGTGQSVLGTSPTDRPSSPPQTFSETPSTSARKVPTIPTALRLRKESETSERHRSLPALSILPSEE